MNTGYVYSPVAAPVADVSEIKNEENNPKTSSLCPTTTSMSHLPAAPQRRRFNSSSGPARRFKASHVFALFYLLYVVLYVSPSFQSSPNRPALDRGYVCCQPPRVASPPVYYRRSPERGDVALPSAAPFAGHVVTGEEVHQTKPLTSRTARDHEPLSSAHLHARRRLT